jgi:hypothetical protein
MIDDFHGEFAGLGLIEWPAFGAIESIPRGFIDIGTQGALQFIIRFVAAGEIGVADKETLAVVIRVDEPAGDIIGR